MIEFLAQQLDYVHFSCGLAFVLLAATAGALAADGRGKAVWSWLGLFGVVLGLVEGMEILGPVVGGSSVLDVARLVGLAGAYACLLEFARQGSPGRLARSRLWPAAAAVALALSGWQWGLDGAQTALGYVLAAPASVWAAWSLIGAARARGDLGRPLRVAGCGLALFGLASMLSTGRPALPATILDAEVYRWTVGVPLQYLRAILAAGVTVSLWLHLCRVRGGTMSTAAPSPWMRHRHGLTSTIVLVLVGGWIATQAVGSVQAREQRRTLVSRASTVAAMLPVTLLEQLSGSSADTVTETYQVLHRGLAAVCQQDSDVQAASLIGLRGGAFFYLVQATASGRTGGPDQPAVPGDRYLLPDVGPVGLFLGERNLPQVHDYATTISTLVPIRSPADGRLTSALDLQVRPSDWRRGVARARLAPMVVTGLASALLLAYFVAKRKMAESSARTAASERQYRSLVEGSPNGIMLLDHDERCLTINGHGLEVFGLKESEITGRRLADLWPPDERGPIEAVTRRCRQGECASVETRYVRGDGLGSIIEVVLNPVIDGDGRLTHMVGIATNITDRQRTQLALERGHRFTQVILGISARFLGLRTERVDAATREALREVGMFLEVDRTQLFHLRPDRTRFSLTHEWCAPSAGSHLATLQDASLADYPWLWSTIEKSGVVMVPRVELMPETAAIERASMLEQGIGAFLCVAVHHRGIVTGFLVLEVLERHRDWPEDEVTLLRIVADVLSNAQARKQAEEALRESEQRFQKAFQSNPAPMAIFWTDNRQIVEVNDAWLGLVGNGRGDVVGRSVDDLELIVDTTAREAVEQALTGRATMRDFEMQFRTGSGEIRDVALSMDGFELAGQRFLLAVAIDMTARTRAEEALREREEIFSSISAAAEDAIIMIDQDSRVTVWNDAAERLFGYTRDEAEGQPLYALIIPEEHETPFLSGFAQFRMTGEGPFIGSGQQIHARHKDGSKIPVELSASAVRLRDRWHAVGIIRDITERLKVDEALWKAKEETEAANSELQRSVERANRLAEEAAVANAAKSEFLANMSHEIRTPMNGIIGMTGLLLDTRLTAEQQEFTDTVRHCADSLLSIINEVLDFSKIEAGKLGLEVLDFDLGTTLEDMIDILAIRAHEKGLELACLVAPDVPMSLRGDPGRLRQVVTNLVGNAIKFTEVGEVTLSISADEVSGEDVLLRFVVHDTGIGIPADKLGTLFQPFTQVDSSTTRRFGGTGLGLSISRRLAELMGGQVGVESEAGAGSSFWFTARFAVQPLAARRHPPPLAEIEGLRVLGVDDNGTNRRVLAGLLESWHCRHDEVDGWESAIALLRQAAHDTDPYRVAILDMVMPRVAGDELGRRIKADPLIKDTALVMMTSAGRRGEVSRLEEIGFSGYLTKPVKASQLLALLRTLAGRQEEGPVDGEPIVTRFTLAEAARRKIRLLLAEDNITNQKVATKVLEKMGHRVDAVANGAEALKALGTMPYDLVLMDVQMPEMDGFEATRQIRLGHGGVRNPRIPIIAMTAHTMKGDRERCLESGMDDYVSKPIKSDELAAAIARWTTTDPQPEAQGATVAPAEAPTLAAVPVRPATELDRGALLARVGGDVEIFVEVLQIFLDDTPRQFVAMDEALAGGDGPTLRRLAHSLKGSSGTAGATGLQQVAFDLEQAAASGDLVAAAALLAPVKEAFAAVRETMMGWMVRENLG
ncbi:MAG TPA: PAS domain S-box protein [Vicinamibacterales bacterium]|jgi:PAS domain S-box-containing protein